jgi:hypothetical protein
MITKLDIQEKDGFLIMNDFPDNCIFNKVKTGCGATTIALTNNENYITKQKNNCQKKFFCQK